MSKRNSIDEATLLAAASRLLAERGPDKLTVRAIADAAGCSTMAIYSRFGNKQGVVEALFAEGFEVLGRALDRLWDALGDDPDPIERLVAMTRMYRRVALEHATHYAIMFGDAVPGFEASDEARATGMATFSYLVRAIAAAQASGQLRPSDPTAEAHILWGTCHGMVNLELQDMVPEPEAAEARYDDAVSTLLAGMARSDR